MTPATLQRTAALARANEIRSRRAELKREIRDGTLTITKALAGHRDDLGTMEIGELLEAQRDWGPTTVRRFLRALEIDPSKQIGTLTARQIGLITGQPPLAVRDRVRTPGGYVGRLVQVDRVSGTGWVRFSDRRINRTEPYRLDCLEPV